MDMNRESIAIDARIAHEADRYAIDVMKIPSLDLMYSASSSVCDFIMEEYFSGNLSVPSSVHLSDCRSKCLGDKGGEGDKGDKAETLHLGKKIICVAGVGNNGGDGACIAGIIKEKDIKNVETQLIVCGNLEKASWEFLYQLSVYKKLGGNVKFYKAEGDLRKEALSIDDKKSVIIVDALFGTGLAREVAGSFATVISEMNELKSEGAVVVAVDVPSGINTDNGKVMGIAAFADATVTFGYNKKGLITKTGKEYAGRVIVKDIGIPEEAYRKVMHA